MLGINCVKCNSQLLKLAGYQDRKRLTVGLFCPECLVFVEYTKDFDDLHIKTIKNNKSKKKLNPKFLRKERKACPYCIKTTIDIYDKNGRFIRTEKKKSTVNKSKWYIRKLPEKKNETQHWKCTCKICGNVWTTNTDEQYHYYSDDMDKQFHRQQKLGL